MRSLKTTLPRGLRLGGAIVLAAILSFGQARAGNGPALWLATSPTAKVYLFGTIHVMKPDVVWTTPAIDGALAQSDDLWLEIPDDLRDPTALMPQIRELGMDPQHPLSTKVSKDDLALLDADFKAAGLPGEAAFEPFRPWFAALMVSVLPASKAGYSGANGIDATLRSKMIAAGKPVKGFETVSDQLHLFADLSPAQELAFLHETLVTMPSGNAPDKAPGTDQLATLWRSGDVEQVAKLEAQLQHVDPSLTAIFLTNRNANWAKQLDARLHGTGTSFVAVGMLHVSGSGSLIEDLTKLGYTVTRVE